jgi:hypothetical protein
MRVKQFEEHFSDLFNQSNDMDLILDRMKNYVRLMKQSLDLNNLPFVNNNFDKLLSNDVKKVADLVNICLLCKVNLQWKKEIINQITINN